VISPVLFSSATDEWATPQAFFDRLNDEFHFTVDVCADAANAKCARYFDLAANGLQQSWTGETWWCNPPYGRAIGDWTQKAAAHAVDSVGVMLLPARTDTKWFHDDVLPFAYELRFIRGRLYFGGAPSAAPFPSVLALFGSRRLPRLTAVDLTAAERGVPTCA
jgi:phage N-6-adenine-methyltransferase